MSSVTAAFAQVDRRVGYFLTLAADISGYDVSQNTTNYNSWNAAVISSANLASIYGVTAATSNQILEDMGEMAKVGGYILRKVRKVTQVAAGGALPAFWIVVPGGEYPVAGVAAATGGLTVALVARLG